MLDERTRAEALAFVEDYWARERDAAGVNGEAAESARACRCDSS